MYYDDILGFIFVLIL